jgi:hypothetical protein
MFISTALKIHKYEFLKKLNHILSIYVLLIKYHNKNMSLLKSFYLPILSQLFPKPLSTQKLNLTDFTQVKVIKDDVYNKIPDSYIMIDFYDKLNNDKYAGFIRYRAGVG